MGDGGIPRECDGPGECRDPGFKTDGAAAACATTIQGEGNRIGASRPQDEGHVRSYIHHRKRRGWQAARSIRLHKKSPRVRRDQRELAGEGLRAPEVHQGQLRAAAVFSMVMFEPLIVEFRLTLLVALLVLFPKEILDPAAKAIVPPCKV